MNSIIEGLKHKVLILTYLPLFVVPLIFLETTVEMVNVWMVNETFTHGFLVLPLCVWLIWKKRADLTALEIVPAPRVFALLAPALVCWILAAAVDVQVVQQFSMIFIIINIVWLIVGWQALSKIRFPLLMLFFAVPFGQSLIPPLMEFTANMTVLLVRLSGIPIYQEGLFFTLPSGSWSVVEECSGVRYLIASVALGAIYAYLNYTSPKKIIIFMLMAIVVPIVGNVLRAYGIVLTGHLSGMTLAVGVDHLLYGWVFFGILIFVMFYAGSFWWDAPENAAVANSAQPESTGNRQNTGSSSLFLLTALMLAIMASVSVSFIKDKSQRTNNKVSIELPDFFAGWQYEKDRELEWQPIFTRPDVSISRSYIYLNELVQLNIAYYQSQRQGAEAISSSNAIVDPLGGEWKKIKSTEMNRNLMYFTETEVRGPQSDVLVWYWYKVGEFATPDPYVAKILDAYNLIVKGRTDAAMITLATRLDADIEISRQRIEEFWNEASIQIDDILERLAAS